MSSNSGYHTGATARLLEVYHPDLTYREVAELAGVKESSAKRLLNLRGKYCTKLRDRIDQLKNQEANGND